ncbi:glycoside hydrolase family 26 protein [Mycolicibacterium arseniciresistens]|uniref:Glycosyl hydrolase n=1 Tax=Mycolicibacterium arseniciresistens TaxID=3062257 RepID=A0ABT8UFV5_9MYCO|nr:glycosyl hydrolase [Mycolicibacterium arseniciresistens]MDO3636664.1 glycosyl hydrolase [Mycolicibacterium arseniciresistens]
MSTQGGPLAAQELAEVGDAVGKTPEFVLWYEDFASPPPVAKIDAVIDRAAQPVITWEPRLWHGESADPVAAILPKIKSGCYDDYLREWAEGLAGARGEVLLRFAHEFNGTWYPWSAGAGTSAEEYVLAWRHVHHLFSERGAANVRWVWAPDAGPVGEDSLTRWYPGDECVDVLGIDGYNWGTTLPGSRWTGPTEIFGHGLAELRRLCDTKPILVTEVGCAEAGGDKAEWIGELVHMMAGEPQVTGFIWFHHDKETDWRLTSTAAAAAAMGASLSEAAA